MFILVSGHKDVINIFCDTKIQELLSFLAYTRFLHNMLYIFCSGEKLQFALVKLVHNVNST